MNLQQFRFIRETIRRNFNLTEASRVLFTSQPGVSKAIIEFEEELGLKVFERHGKRIKGLTKPGHAVASIIERVMLEVDNLKKVSDEFARRDEGSLIIGCTHTQARYFLSKVIPLFRQRFPKVRVSLAEGNPAQLAEMVLAGQADIALATETLAEISGLVTLPCYEWEHTLVMLPNHPLTELTSSQAKVISLEQLAQYPIITYDKAFSGRRSIDQAFNSHNIQPDIVLEAIDADVIKTYVSVDMGIGIIAGVAYDPRRDKDLVGIPVGHLFGRHVSRVGFKQGTFLRDYVYDFIEMLGPNLSRKMIDEAIELVEEA